jgi:hypothetical protein
MRLPARICSLLARVKTLARVLSLLARVKTLARVLSLLAVLALTAAPVPACASIATPTPPSPAQTAGGSEGASLESAAAKAGSTGRAVAMSLIGLAFAVAAIVLAFRRDFKEAAGVFAVGIVSVLLATPTGVSLLQDTVNSLFGSH